MVLRNQNKDPQVSVGATYNVRHCFGLFTVAMFVFLLRTVVIGQLFTEVQSAVMEEQKVSFLSVLSYGEVNETDLML